MTCQALLTLVLVLFVLFLSVGYVLVASGKINHLNLSAKWTTCIILIIWGSMAAIILIAFTAASFIIARVGIK